MQIAEQQEPKTFITLPRKVRAWSSQSLALMSSSSSTKSSRPKPSNAWISVRNRLRSAAAVSPPPTAEVIACNAAQGLPNSLLAMRCAKGSESAARPARFAANRASSCFRLSTCRFFDATRRMVRSRRCSTSATCCCVTGRRKECMLLKGKFTAPKPLSTPTTVTPSTPMRAIRRSAESTVESMWIILPDRKIKYQNSGNATAAQESANRCDPLHTDRTAVHTKQAGSTM
mmetsp:Transcript_114770/g.244946  ORF Transcript_114770/g.244946 Transcript_114770/m.244946 type:complete len:230 (+) Transcript_114770:515-1204(+)